MKKIAALLLATLLSTSAFAEFFGPRFFEIETNLPFSVTNNAFMLSDIMQTNAVLDFGKMAEDLPKSGFTSLNTVNPSIGFNLNLGDLNAGAKVGVDAFTKFNLSKDFFNFIGKGNKLNEEMTFAMTMNFDAFYNYSAYLAVPFGNYRIKIAPTVFAPLVHVTTEDSRIIVNNTEDGTLTVDLKAAGKMYTYSAFGKGDYYPKDGYGFDFGAEVEIPIFDGLIVTGSMRTPVVPGHLNYVSDFSYSTNIESKILKFLSDDNKKTEPEFEKEMFERTSFAMHRPFKLNGLADLTPMGDFLHLYGGVGLGVRNPFLKGTKSIWYPEYYFGCLVKAGGIASCTASTEYTDQLFKHSLEGTLNFRVFELDLGLSMASSSMGSSFRGAGFAGYVVTKWGF